MIVSVSKIEKYLAGSNSYSSCGNFYNFELLKNNNIFFNEQQKFSEDAVFVKAYISVCRRVVIIPFEVYFVDRLNLDSVSKKGNVEYA